MHEEALAELKDFIWEGDREVAEALDRGYAEGGYRRALTRAADTLAARSRTTYVNPIRIYGLYVRAGKNDRALDWLERAFEVRDPTMPYIGVGQISPNLRDHPRFQDLLRRMNRPPSQQGP